MPHVLQSKAGLYVGSHSKWSKELSGAKFYDDGDDEPMYRAVSRVEVDNYTAGFYGLWTILVDRDGDEYGWAMIWLFCICDHLTFVRHDDVPAEWQYRPSPIAPDFEKEDEFQHEILRAMCSTQLLYIGGVLHRYIAILKKAGKDY